MSRVLSTALALAITAAIPSTAQAGQRSFDYTGGEQVYVVPAGVTSVHARALGARGGLGQGVAGGQGGFGAMIDADISVTPGQRLYIQVGQTGNDGCCLTRFNGGGAGGNNAGADSGDPGAGGGGATDVRRLPRSSAGSLSSRVLVAGGGGGGGGDGPGGAFLGGNAGEAGSGNFNGGGGAGTATSGGAAGPGPVAGTGDDGTAGVLGIGGTGGSDPGDTAGGGGGGGGGGLYGGGGGAFGSASGGGGSSYSISGGTPTVNTSATPRVIITWTDPPVIPPPKEPTGTVGPAVASAVKVARRAFPAAPSGPSAVLAQKKKRKRVYGTVVSYALDQAARVRFTVERRTRGRRNKKGKCVKPTRKNRKRRRCTRYPRLRGGFTLDGQAGTNSFRFTGRLRGRLKPARYRLVATPTVAGRKGTAARVAFRIVK